jgi:PTH2 family peptidyl-tRNA hydrolase
MKYPKQVIVVRKDLNMRKGKIAAQAAHASMAVLLNYGSYAAADGLVSEFRLDLTKPALNQWLSGAFTKVCVSVNSEQELLELCEKAQGLGFMHALITDSGKTEFNGVPTKTCAAFGPEWNDELDKLTGHLPLL